MESNKFIKAFWYSSNNFGDALNYYLLSKLSGKEVIHASTNEPHLMAIGSILTSANKNSTVWGAGIANKEDSVSPEAKTIAVRGKLSRESCVRAGHINEIFLGDPALLMPEFYSPKIEKKYPVGIIPHWVELEKCINYFGDTSEVKIINPFRDIFSFVDLVLSCEQIFSSSLHGLIIADAYKVPNKWVSFGENIGGDGTKFHDYYSNTGFETFPTLININHLPHDITFIQDNSQAAAQLKSCFPI